MHLYGIGNAYIQCLNAEKHKCQVMFYESITPNKHIMK